MEAITSNKECWYYMKLLTFTLGIGMEVLHNYFEQKILNAMEFYVFLESYKHCLFHECYPTLSCCECSKNRLASNLKKGCLTKSQFLLLYDIVPLTKKDHYISGKNNKITQECLCRIDAKTSNEVDCMDITLMCAIINSCFVNKNKTIYGNPRHLETIKNTRNFLAHAPRMKISESEFHSKLAETEQAISGIANAVGKYFAKENKRKIDEFKNNDLTMEKIKVIIESNADEVKEKLQAILETQKNSTTVVTDVKKIIELLEKFKVDIGKLRFEVEQYTKANSSPSQEETCDCQGPNMDTASCTSSEKQMMGKEKDVKKCRLEWRLEIPDSWNVTEIQETLVKFSGLLRPWFEIEFVYVGSLVIKTLVQKQVLCNRDQMRTSVHSFLEKIVEICKINTDVPEVIKVALIIEPEDFEYEGVMSAKLRRSARKRKNMPIVATASARKKAKQRVSATTSVPAPHLPTVDSAIIPATSSAGIYPILYSQTGPGLYTSASTCPVASMSTVNTRSYSRVPDQRGFNTVTSQDAPEHSLENDEDKENFVRLCSLLIQIAPIAVRYCFDNLFPEGLDETLKRFTNFNDGIDLKCCKDHSVIKDNDNVDNCAVPLMLLLLKYYRDIRILDDELPVPSDTSIDADLTRIKYYTQLIVDQRTTRSLISTTFNDIWNTVSEAITRLGDVQTRQYCENLKKANLGEMNKDILLGLIEVQKKIIMLRKKKDELTERLPELKNPLSDIIQGKIGNVEEWVVEDKMFVETRSSDLLLKHSLDKHIKSITVVGSFGIGKTSTTRHIALVLRQQGYRILPVSTCAEIKYLDDEDIPTLFIVDDFCGSITCSVEKRTRDIKMWKKMAEDLLGSKSKIIVCCTSMVYQHTSSKCLSYFRSCVIDMNSSDLALNSDELRSIAKINADINDKLIKMYSMEFSFFPFLCKICSMLSVQASDTPKFISHQAIFEIAGLVYSFQLNTFRKVDKAKYAALALIVQLDNKVKEGYFIETSEDYISILYKLNKTLRACKFDMNNELSDIKEELKSMIGSYIKVSAADSRNNVVYSAVNLDVYGVLETYFKRELPKIF